MTITTRSGSVSKRAATVGVAGLALAALIYTALPLVRAEAAHNACVRSLSGDGAASTEWVPFPVAHWVCRTTPAGETETASDMGWWP